VTLMRVYCNDCGKDTDFTAEEWRCGCGGAWELAELPAFDQTKIRQSNYSIWRYGDLIGLDIRSASKHMGVGWTPLVQVPILGRKTYLKLEYFSPSGSFKDRGVNAMVNQLVFMGVQCVAEDSSGNAGASLAAHAARFGIQAKIFVPDYTSTGKKSQIGVYGAKVNAIPGLRSAAEKAAQASVSDVCTYASHGYNPAYLAGQATSAYEIWEQMERKAPDWIVLPVAQGGLLLGCWIGFSQLLNARLIEKLPMLVAVQSARIAPIYEAWKQGWDHIPEAETKGQTIAEGVAISKPVRDKRILQALRETKGKVLAIDEEAIMHAQQMIAHMGYFIEPTSALAVAGFLQLENVIKENETVVLPMTGSGLKGLPQY